MADELSIENPQSIAISTLQLGSPLETPEISETDQQIESSDIQFGSMSDPSLLLYNSLRKNLSETELKCQMFYIIGNKPSLPYTFSHPEDANS